MKNPFRSICDYFKSVKHRADARREHRRAMQTIAQVALVHETFNSFRRAGLLFIDFKRQVVTIAQLVASQYIYDPEEWQTFLSNLHLWAVTQYQIAEYTRLYTQAQADAEAKAYKQNKNLTPSERKLAKMEAAARFDEEHADKNIQCPDLQFVVLGMADGQPMLVARMRDKTYETLPVPDLSE